MIYHVTTRAELRACTKAGTYRPSSLDTERFVHCAESGSVVAVANDLFAASRDVVVLEIDPERLGSALRYEAPAPLAGGTSHLRDGARFPHVYGPIEVAAIRRIGLLEASATGFLWPEEWQDAGCVLDSDGAS